MNTSAARPRVLIFSTAYFPHVGGAEVAIREITNRLSHEYDFDLICARYGRELPRTEKIDAVRVFRVGFGIRILDKLLAPFLGTLLALRLTQKHSYALYWAMMVTYGSGAAYLTNIVSRRNVPVVLTLQEGDPPHYIRTKWFGLVGFSWRLALKRSRAVTVISTYLARLAKEFGYNGEPVLVPNGVDLARFVDVADEDRRIAKDILQKKDGDVFLVTTSRLVEKNAVDDVLRALPHLPHNVSFLMYGVGPDEEALRALAKKLGVEDRARFLGQATHTELPALLAASDIFIRPSRSEGMGNSFIEAMAVGLPVVATQVGGIGDFLFDEKRNPDKEATGFAVDINSPEHIAEVVTTILASPEKAREIAKRAQELVMVRYGWERIAGSMSQVFRKLIG